MNLDEQDELQGPDSHVEPFAKIECCGHKKGRG
jgi:hypothetical protein